MTGPGSCHTAEAAFTLHRHGRPHEAHGKRHLAEGLESAHLEKLLVQQRRDTGDGAEMKQLERVALRAVSVNGTNRACCRMFDILRPPEVDEGQVEVTGVIEADFRAAVIFGDLRCEELRDEHTGRPSGELS